MLNNLFNKSKQKKFWNWLSKNKDDYFSFTDDNREELFNTLTQKLTAIDDNLTFEFSPIKDDGLRDFMISADGVLDSFPEVISLVNQAPNVDGFNVVAFRQRVQGDDIEINYGDLNIGYSNLYFRYEQDNKKIGIEINIDAYDEEDNRFKNAVYILMDGLIGEFDVETKISWIEWADLNGSNKEKLLPFVELRRIVDENNAPQQ